MADSTMTAIKQFKEFKNQIKICQGLKSKVFKDDFDKLIKEIEEFGKKHLKNKVLTEEDYQNYFEAIRNLTGLYIQAHQGNPEKISQKTFDNRMKAVGELFRKAQAMYATFATQEKLTASEQNYADVIEQTGREKKESVKGLAVAKKQKIAGILELTIVVTGLPMGSDVVKFDSKTFEVSAVSIDAAGILTPKVHVYLGVKGGGLLLNPALVTMTNELGSGRIN